MSFLVEVTIERGQDTTLAWRYRDETHPVDLTGWSGEARFQDTRGRTLASFTTVNGGLQLGTDGVVAIDLPGPTTAAWPFWQGRLNITLYDPTDRPVPFIDGIFTATDAVPVDDAPTPAQRVPGVVAMKAQLDAESNVRAAADLALSQRIDSIDIPEVPGLTPFTYTAPVAQTTHVVNHQLGRDPISVEVRDIDDGDILVDNFSYVILTPGQTCRIAFDIPLRVKIRMI